MSGTFLRWGIPALLTVVGGTAAAVFTTGAAIPQDLERKAIAALASPDTRWAEVRFDMQDAVVTGTATSSEAVEAAVAKVAAIYGVREVRAEVALAETIRPYPFIVAVAGGKLAISGAFPDSDARDQLLGRLGADVVDKARLLGGVPERNRWLAAAGYALDQAIALDEGEVALSDLDLTMSGRARSPESLARLETLVAQAPPAGVTVKFREIDPPLATPFEWSATYDGVTLEVSGVVPDSQFMSTLEALLPPTVKLKSSVQMASGSPPDFTRRALVLVQNILRLQSGTASISDMRSELAGSPADPKAANAITTALAAISAKVTLEAPFVADYIVTARNVGGGIVLTGYAPTVDSVERLAALAGVDASAVSVARGAPDQYEDGVAFVLQAARLLSDGAASLRGTVVDIAGRATTEANYQQLQTSLKLGAPRGLMLGRTEISLPLADPYRFSAVKSDAGDYRFEGVLPSELQRAALRGGLPAVTDATSLADGAPQGFLDAARSGIAALAALRSGSLEFDGQKWSLEGVAPDADSLEATRAAAIAAGFGVDGTRLSIAEPAVPTIVDYTFVASKAADGTMTLSGYLPDESTRQQVLALSHGAAVDSTRLALGAPEGFAKDLRSALDALTKARSGSVSLSGGQWTFSAEVANAAERAVVETMLQSTSSDGRWHVSVQAENAAPVVTPYVWSARKSDTGAVVLSGYVPSEAVRAELEGLVASLSQDTTLVGSGEPMGFSVEAGAGLRALALLSYGEAVFDGQNWSLTGALPSENDRQAVAIALDGVPGWTVDLTVVAPLVGNDVAVTPDETGTDPDDSKAADAAVDEPSAVAAAGDNAAETSSTDVGGESPAVAALPGAEFGVDVRGDADEAAAGPANVAPAEATAPDMTGPFLFEARKAKGQGISFAGAVPDEPARTRLAEIAGVAHSDDVALDAGLPLDFVKAAEAGINVLAALNDGALGFDGTQWKLVGRANGDEERQAALGQVAALPGGAWNTSITLIPPLERCRNTVGELAGRNAIVFQSGSATLTKGSMPVLDELAGDLAACPEATVNVEGHTDADGEAEVNLALSVARAEAVVNELILRGVGPERLYAVGYGESVPVAANDTKAGKQANRRIAFTLADE